MGWCYVDETDSTELVANCPATEQQKVRFVGEGVPDLGSTTFILCGSD